MNAELIEQLVACYETQLQAHISQEERVQAMGILDEFKAGSPLVADAGFHLAHLDQGFSPNLRLFGLQLLESVIKERWNGLDDEYKAIFRGRLVEDLVQGYGGEMRENYLREKIGSLLSEIAKREWPQRWLDMIDNFITLSGIGLVQADIVCSAIAYLVDDVMTGDETLEPRRSKEVRDGLNACCSQILQFLSTMASTFIYSPSIADADHAIVICMTRVVKAMASFMPWCPLSAVFSQGIIPLCYQLLHNPSLNLMACDCLLLIFERKGNREDRAPLLRTIDYLNALVSAVPPLSGGEHFNEEAYTFVKKLAQIVVLIGTGQICPLWGPQGVSNDPPPHFPLFVKTLFDFTHHSSLLVFSFTLPFWIAICRHEYGRVQRCVADCLQPLLRLCRTRIAKPNFEEALSNPSADCISIDFDEEEEFLGFFSLMRTRVGELIRLIASLQPAQSVELAFSSLVYEAQSYNDSSLTPSIAPFVYSAWECLSFSFRATFDGVFPSFNVQSPSIVPLIPLLNSSFQTILSLDTSNPFIITEQIDIISSLVPYLRHFAEYLGLVVDKLLWGAVFEDSSKKDSSAFSTRTGLSDESKVRLKACSAIVSLCTCPPPCLLAALDDMCVRVQELLRLPSLSEMQQRLLVEALLNAANLLPTCAAQETFIHNLLGPFIEQFLSPEFENIIGNVENFSAYGSLNDWTLDSLENRKIITTLMNTFSLAMRVTKSRPTDAPVPLKSEKGAPSASTSPLLTRKMNLNASFRGESMSLLGIGANGEDGPPTDEPVLAELNGVGGCEGGGDGFFHPAAALTRMLLPNIIQFLATLHLLHGRASNDAITKPELHQIFDLRRSDIAGYFANLGGLHFKKEMTEFESWMDRTQLWLSHIRESLYHMLSEACKQGVLYELQSLNEILNSSCFLDLGFMQNRHLKALVRVFVYSFVKYLPRNFSSEASMSHVALVGQFMQELDERLTSQWQRSAAPRASFIALPSLEVSEESVSNYLEIVEDKLLQELSQVTINLVRGIFSSAQSSEVPFQFGATALAVFSSENACAQIFNLLCHALVWPSSASCLAGCACYTSILPSLAANNDIHPFISERILNAALIGLSYNGRHTECETALVGLLCAIFEVVSYLPSTRAVFEMHQITSDEIIQFEAAFFLTNSVKTRRNEVKKFVRPLVGIYSEQVFRKRITILNLPEKLFLAKKAPLPTLDELESSDLGFNNLFDEEKS